MLALALTAAIALAPAQKGDDEPLPREVRTALEKLESAWGKKSTPADKVAAIQGSAEVTHPLVIERVTEGLAEKDEEVRRSAVDALGQMQHADALAALHAFAKKERKTLPKSPEFYIATIKAIARHGDKESIEVITDKMFAYPDAKLIGARVLGLAHIRDKESIETLFDVMKLADRRKVQGQMRNIRLALMVLTGADEGEDQDRWRKWWSKNGKDFEVKSQMPKLPEEAQRRWDGYWGYQRKYERGTKRGERGQDPEDDGGGASAA
jgi:hypothetical protein